MQISEVDPFAFSTPGWCHLQEGTHLGTGHLQTSVCLVASMLDGYAHPEKTGFFLILYVNLTMETLKLEGQMLKEEKDGHCLKCK